MTATRKSFIKTLHELYPEKLNNEIMRADKITRENPNNEALPEDTGNVAAYMTIASEDIYSINLKNERSLNDLYVRMNSLLSKLEQVQLITNKALPVRIQCIKCNRFFYHPSTLTEHSREYPDHLYVNPGHVVIGRDSLYLSTEELEGVLISKYHFPIGIKQKDRDYLFDEYYRLEKEFTLIKQRVNKDNAQFKRVLNDDESGVELYESIYVDMNNLLARIQEKLKIITNCTQ